MKNDNEKEMHDASAENSSVLNEEEWTVFAARLEKPAKPNDALLSIISAAIKAGRG